MSSGIPSTWRRASSRTPSRGKSSSPRDGQEAAEEEGSVRFVGSTQVKGKKEPVELFEIIWDRENLTIVKDVFEAKGRTPG